MRKKERTVAKGFMVVSLWVLSVMPVFAWEGNLMTVIPTVNQASVITQTGSLNVLGYIAVGVAMAGFGFAVRKKI